MDQVPDSTSRRYYRIDRRQIHFLKFVLEGYDGVAVLRTVDARQGLVILHIGPGSQGIVDRIIADLQRSIRIEPVQASHCGGEETFGSSVTDDDLFR